MKNGERKRARVRNVWRKSYGCEAIRLLKRWGVIGQEIGRSQMGTLAVPVPFGSIAPQQLGPNGTGALSELAVAFGGFLVLLLL
jgi:hypothetical protein